MRVLIAGAGAIGQWLGSQLNEAHHDVTLLTTQRHVDAFAVEGLCVRGLSNSCWYPATSTSAEALRDEPAFEAIVLTAKAHNTAHLAEATAPLLADDGVFLSLQNGLGNAEKIARFVPDEQVAVGTTSHGVTVESPGHLLHAGLGATHLGPYVPSGEPAARAAFDLLADPGLQPEWHAAMRGQIWRKAMLNAALNPVAALYGARNGEVVKRPELWGLCLGVLQEAKALAQRARVHLPEGDLEMGLLATLDATADNKCSMLQDVEARRATEVEQLNGRMVRLGEKLLVSMPRMESLYGRLKDMEGSYLGSEAATAMAWDELAWEKDPF